MNIMSAEQPTIPEFYRGRSVLITGGSGFMGKVLVEKLLRSCPDVDTVYLLLRGKKGRDADSRIRDITDLPLFDRLKQENPGALDKLVAVDGDMKQLGLALSPEDRATLQDRVSVVFHSAASVRFDDPLREAVFINVRGTRELLELAKDMKKLKVLLHLSTSYCNFNERIVEEKLYDAPADWRKMIHIAEKIENEQQITALTHMILGPNPNTYTFAKALSEQVVNDYCHVLPVVIVRPSIVISSLSEPMPGWVDNFNGPVGLMVAGGKGLLRSVHADPNNIGDYVPVDVAIKSIIFIAWHTAMTSCLEDLPVYNCCTLTEPTTLYDVIDEAKKTVDECAVENVIWYMNPTITANKHLHYIKILLFHMLPALVLDGVLKLAGKKTMFIKLHRKIFIANETLSVFTTNEVTFHNEKFKSLQDRAMLKSDIKDFGYNTVLNDKENFMRASLRGARKYLLHEPDESIASSIEHNKRMYWLDRFSKAFLLILFIWSINVPALMTACATFIYDLVIYIVDNNFPFLGLFVGFLYFCGKNLMA